MLQSISWQEFFTAISLILGTYYAISTLLLYSGEIKSIFNHKKSNVTEEPIAVDQNDSNESNDLMGKVKYMTAVNVPHGKSVDAEEIAVNESREVEDSIEITVPDSPEAILAKGVAELFKQANTLLSNFPPNDREEVLLIFKPLLSKFPQIVGTPFQDEVNIFIQNVLAENNNIQVEPNDIKSWWTEDGDTN